MANCIGKKKPELAPVIFAIANIVKEYTSEETAMGIANNLLTKNNGNVLSRNPDGSPSQTLPIIEGIVGRESSLYLRMKMYEDGFISRYGNWLSTNEEPQIQFITAGVNIETTGNSPMLFSNGTLGDIELQNSSLAKDDDSMRKCLGLAKDGLRGRITKGGMWNVEKDFFNAPRHSEGGIDIIVSNKGVSFNNGNTLIRAKKGVVTPSGNEYVQQTQKHFGYQDSWLATLYGAAASGITHIEPKINSFTKEIEAKKLPNKKSIEKVVDAPTVPFPVVEDNNTYGLEWDSRYQDKFGETQTVKTKCEEGMCAAFVEMEMYDNYKPNLPEGYNLGKFMSRLGLKGNAWHMSENLRDKDATDIANNDSQPGDVMFINNSNHKWKDGADNGDEIAHVGVIDKVTDDYIVVLHSYDGKMYRQKVNKETGKFNGSNTFTLAHVIRPDYSKL